MTTTPETAVEVRSAAVQPGVIYLFEDSEGVIGTGGQFLLLEVRTDAGIERTEFAFEFDGTSHAPETFPQQLTRRPYRAGRGWLVFDLSERGDAGDARLTWPGGEWRPPERVQRRLAAPLPTFEVEFTAPETASVSDAPTLLLRVTNPGDHPGVAVLALNRQGPDVAYIPVREFRIDLAPGETFEWKHTGRAPYNGNEVRYLLRTLNGRIERTIEPEEESQ